MATKDRERNAVKPTTRLGRYAQGLRTVWSKKQRDRVRRHDSFFRVVSSCLVCCVISVGRSVGQSVAHSLADSVSAVSSEGAVVG